MWKKALKVDNLKAPEGDERLSEFLQLLRSQVAQNESYDKLAPWLYREFKKNRLGMGEEGHLGDLYTIPPHYPVDPENRDEGGWGVGYPDTEDHPIFPSQQEAAAHAQQVGSEGPRLGIPHWNDWYGSNAPNRRGLDIMGIKDPREVQNLVDEWDAQREQEQMDQGKMDAYLADDGSKVLHEWPDGWSLRQLTDQDQTRMEGSSELMNHCVGGTDPRRTGIYSLRDPDNIPKTTFEIRPEQGDDGPMYGDDQLPYPERGQVVQIQGNSNSTPKEPERNRLKEWFETFPEEDRPFVSSPVTRLPQIRNLGDLRTWTAPEDTAYAPYDLEQYENSTNYQLPAGPGVELYGLGHRGGGLDKSNPPEIRWDPFVNHLIESPESQARGEEILNHINQLQDLTGQDELSRFRSAIETNLPKVEQAFYNKAYDPHKDIWQADDPQYHDEYNHNDFENQWNNWVFTKLLYPTLPITRDPEGNSFRNLEDMERGPDGSFLPPPGLPNQGLLFGDEGNPPVPGKQWYNNERGRPEAITANRRKRKRTIPKKKAMAPVYFRWSFSPRTGVSLSDNERDLDAFVNTRNGSGDADETKGYAYRIGNGWRLTDNEHRAVEDPYVVAQVVKKLDGFKRQPQLA